MASRNKRKSLHVQLARADIIYSQREIKEIFDPGKLTLCICSEDKSVKKSPGSYSLLMIAVKNITTLTI